MGDMRSESERRGTAARADRQRKWARSSQGWKANSLVEQARLRPHPRAYAAQNSSRRRQCSRCCHSFKKAERRHGRRDRRAAVPFVDLPTVVCGGVGFRRAVRVLQGSNTIKAPSTSPITRVIVLVSGCGSAGFHGAGYSSPQRHLAQRRETLPSPKTAHPDCAANGGCWVAALAPQPSAAGVGMYCASHMRAAAQGAVRMRCTGAARRKANVEGGRIWRQLAPPTSTDGCARCPPGAPPRLPVTPSAAPQLTLARLATAMSAAYRWRSRRRQLDFSRHGCEFGKWLFATLFTLSLSSFSFALASDWLVLE